MGRSAMADDDLDGDVEGEVISETGGGGGGKKKLIMIVLPLLLLLGGGAAAYFMGALDSLLGEEPTEETLAEDGEGGGGEDVAMPVEDAVFFDLPELLVNLNTGGRRSQFLKIRISLEVPSLADQQRVEAVMPRVVDNFQTYLRELRIEDLQGSAGMYRLREELLTRVNAAVKPTTVNEVLFKEILVQ